MKDSVIPTLTALKESITISISPTQAQLADQGNTYNQAGLTYNSPVQYGGVYNTNQDTIPSIFVAKLDIPSINILNDFISLKIPATQALLEDQGYTYNQAGFTYDQAIAYGGVYNSNQDVLPLELSFTDIYSPFVPPTTGNIPLGPGFFLFIPQ